MVCSFVEEGFAVVKIISVESRSDGLGRYKRKDYYCHFPPTSDRTTGGHVSLCTEEGCAHPLAKPDSKCGQVELDLSPDPRPPGLSPQKRG